MAYNIVPNSTQFGFVLPSSPDPINDDLLENFFHDVLGSILNLDPTLVRPRWQTNPPNQPSNPTTWLSFGIERTPNQANDLVSYTYTDGVLTNAWYEEFKILCSFYGPQMGMFATRLKAGLSIQQNRDAIDFSFSEVAGPPVVDTFTSTGITYVNCSEPRNVSILINDIWQKKIDMFVTFRRQIEYSYPIESITQVQATLNTVITENILTPIV